MKTTFKHTETPFKHRSKSSFFPWKFFLRNKINRDFIKGGRGGGESPFYEVISQKKITNESFPKLTQPPPVDLSHATSPTVSNVPNQCLQCPPVNLSPFPVNSSPNEQDHIRDLFFPLEVELCVNLTFFINVNNPKMLKEIFI